MKVNDVYRWRYRHDDQRLKEHAPYWCKSMIGVVEKHSGWPGPGLVMVDTYWSSSYQNSAFWGVAEAKRTLELTYLGNLDDYELSNAAALETYREEDILDIRHPNNSRAIYIRKGAEPCREVERAAWTRRRDKAQSTVDYYQSLLDKNT